MNRNRNPDKPINGCLGRMVNLFDFNTNLNANKLLTETPHYERSPVSRSQSDVSRTRPVADQVFDKMPDLPKSPSIRKQNMTPIKTLIAQEMSKEEGPKQSPPNLVAKLMGLDTLPQRKPRSHSRSLDFTHKEDRFMEIKEDNEVKDVFEIWSPQKGSNKELKKDKNMELVREKFMEAKRLSTNENLRQSKQFQEALEVLNSNKDLFLKFLQEPNSLFSQNIHHSQSLPPDSRRITVLKPTKLLDTLKLNKKDDSNIWDKSKTSQPSQPTRIVVLKPNSIKPQEVEIAPSPSTSNEDDFYGDIEDTKETTNGGHRRDETLLSSVFSNGYNGDESSFSKSEVYYAGENLSDSEVMSPVSRHSWDYVNRFGGSPFSSSSFTCSPESSVCREAKKRLSERWAMMSLNGNVLEQRHVRRSSSTLGEMLALSDLKKEEQFQYKGENDHCDDGECSPKSIVRSKSCGSRLGEVSETLKVKKDDDSKNLVKDKVGKSSLFKGLFFSKSRKSSKKLNKDDEENRSSRNVGNEDDINVSLRKESCQDPAGNLPEVETFGNANENQEQPSPNSVLELQFEEDDNTASCSYSAKLKDHGVDLNKFNLIEKSPPIGSISRTLSFDDPTKTSTPEEDEHESYLYVQTLLSLPKTDNTTNPLDQSLRDTYMESPHRSNQKSTQRLIFDCVNEALSASVHADHVWAHINNWKDTCIWEGDDVAVLTKEVVTRVWVEDLKSEIDEIKREIEDKLVNELVEDLILS